MDLEAQIEHKPVRIEGVKDGLYEVYADGRIWSNYKNGFLKLKTDKDGYFVIMLSGKERGYRKCLRVATIVALHFIGNPPPDMIDPTVNHKDFNIHNNLYTNLEWMERSLNSSMRINKPSGSKNPSAILNEEQIKEIYNLIINTNISLAKIGQMYGVTKYTISSIVRRKSWPNIIPDDVDLSQYRRMKLDAYGRFVSYNPFIAEIN